MAPSFQDQEPPENPVRFTLLVVAGWAAASGAALAPALTTSRVIGTIRA
jgi:hypothetical protein